MKKKETQKGLYAIFPYLKEEWIEMIKKEPKELLEKASELRFRLGGGCSISCGEGNFILESINITSQDMEYLLEKICQGAAFQFENQMENGYIPLPGGHRVGICGSFAINEHGAIRIYDLSSMNFRICRDVEGIAERLLPKLMCEGRFCSTLIVSEPCGGKTTLLTDLMRVLSLKGIRSAVIDERGELAAVYRGMAQKEIGKLTDVLDGYPKPYGMMIALRTLSPQVLICDEIGTYEEAERMLEAMNAGVPILASAHARDEEELFNRPQIKRLIDAGAISKIVLLKGAKAPGKIKKVLTVNQYDDEDYWCSSDC